MYPLDRSHDWSGEKADEPTKLASASPVERLMTKRTQFTSKEKTHVNRTKHNPCPPSG
jgi:hypothetical protein